MDFQEYSGELSNDRLVLLELILAEEQLLTVEKMSRSSPDKDQSQYR